ncbi:MAG: cytochrome C biogenesis protein, partial [Candidatus Margulisbacteria bacterium]|nr:cytochrome C biogenesis protein [Candidatus Margulisiibacteriota bacterium]
PILAGILVYASQSESLGEGALLLVAFSLGLGLPLFLFSLAVNYSLSLLKVINKYVGIIQKVCGVGLVIVGVLLLVGRF